MPLISSSKFEIGVVVDVQDTFKNFNFIAKLENGEQVPVVYTSPFFHYGGGGVIAMPNIGSTVILLLDEKNNYYYYISTILPHKKFDWIYDPSPDVMPVTSDQTIYTEKNIPQKILFTNEVDSGLKISRKKLKKYIDAKVELKSEFGKKIALIDSPMHSHVLMRNEHGDGIRIISHDWLAGTNGYPHPIYPSRSIIVFSKGPQFYTTTTGSMNIRVADGTECNIENYSTGAFGSNTSGAQPVQNPSPTSTLVAKNKDFPASRVGNINIRSKKSDINIAVNGTESEIYITTPKARIEIRDDGTVLIHSVGTINLKAEGDINMKSSENVNIEAGNKVNIKSGDNFNIQSSKTLNLKSSDNCNVDGKQIHLNSGFSTEAGSPRDIEIQKNAYGE